VCDSQNTSAPILMADRRILQQAVCVFGASWRMRISSIMR
jgi:hypothetical protein